MSSLPNQNRLRMAAVVVSLVGAMVLPGCATSHNRDPLESLNRKTFAFNDSLDRNVLQPVAKGYKSATPEPVRIGLSNFFGNIKDIWTTVNLFLQGRMKDGAQGVMRVSVNSTFGLLGFIDMATAMQMERYNEDLGQTLGVWGMGPGAYVVWPVLGPSTARDSLGIPADAYFSAATLMRSSATANAMRVVQGVNTRANLLGASDLLDDVALDKYAFLRDAYLQRRQNLIYEGDPPEEDEPSDAGQDQRDSAAQPTPLARPVTAESTLPGASSVGAAASAGRSVEAAEPVATPTPVPPVSSSSGSVSSAPKGAASMPEGLFVATSWPPAGTSTSHAKRLFMLVCAPSSAALHGECSP